MTDTARSRAVRFVDAHGDLLARSRAAALLGTAPLSDVIRALSPRQRVDGSFGGIAGTLEALEILDDLRGLGAPCVETACGFLERVQAGDGSFRPECESGDAARLLATGCVAGRLAKTRFASPALLERAADHLASGFSPALLEALGWPALAGYAHCFANVDHERSDAILQWCGRELERGFRSGRFDALHTARVFVDCDAHALPGARLARDELLAAVAEEQADDGGWGPPADPSSARVAQTLSALASLVRLG